MTAPARPLRRVTELLESARAELLAARRADDARERFRCAHLAALRVAAAVLAGHTQPRRSGRPIDAWTLLAVSSPGHAEDAAYFGAHAATRCAIEAGARRAGAVSPALADEMTSRADLFLAAVTRSVGGGS